MAALTVATDTRSRLTKFAGLAAVERRVLIAAWCLLPSIAVSLRILDYARTRNLMARFLTSTDHATDIDTQVERTTRLVAVAARYDLCRANCLSQALAVWWLLARGGIDSRIRIGVHRKPGGFSAHAWVERDAVIIMGGGDSRERYVTML